MEHVVGQFARELEEKSFLLNSIFKDLNVWGAAGLLSIDRGGSIKVHYYVSFLKSVMDVAIADEDYLLSELSACNKGEGEFAYAGIFTAYRYKEVLSHFVENLLLGFGDVFRREVEKARRSLSVLSDELNDYGMDTAVRKVRTAFESFLAKASHDEISKLMLAMTESTPSGNSVSPPEEGQEGRKRMSVEEVVNAVEEISAQVHEDAIPNEGRLLEALEYCEVEFSRARWFETLPEVCEMDSACILGLKTLHRLLLSIEDDLNRYRNGDYAHRVNALLDTIAGYKGHVLEALKAARVP